MTEPREVLSSWRVAAVPRDPAEKTIHQAILRSFARTGSPPPLEELDGSVTGSGRTIREVLAALHERDAIRLTPGGRVASAYPFSARRPGIGSGSVARLMSTPCVPSTPSGSRRCWVKTPGSSRLMSPATGRSPSQRPVAVPRGIRTVRWCSSAPMPAGDRLLTVAVTTSTSSPTRPPRRAGWPPTHASRVRSSLEAKPKLSARGSSEHCSGDRPTAHPTRGERRHDRDQRGTPPGHPDP